MPNHFPEPFMKSDTIARMKAMGRRIQPTMSAPGMHAKMNPTIDTMKATRARTLRPGFGVVGGWWPGAGCW
jgi:hypothetical protein